MKRAARAFGLAWLAVVALLLASSCAPRPALLVHSEMWRVCAAHCSELGGLDPTVVEDEGHRGCICAMKKPPEGT